MCCALDSIHRVHRDPISVVFIRTQRKVIFIYDVGEVTHSILLLTRWLIVLRLIDSLSENGQVMLPNAFYIDKVPLLSHIASPSLWKASWGS